MGVNRLRQFAVLGIAILLALGSLDCRAAASDEDPGPTKASDDADSGANKRAAGAGKVDPVAAAFKLPKGVSLNAQQQTAYDNLKAAKEPELRQAFDEVQSAKVGASTAQALKKVHECRAEIRKGIDAIVNGTATGLSTKAGQASTGSGSEGSGSGGYAPPQYGGYGNYGNYGVYGPPPYGYYPYGPYYRNARYPYYYPMSGSSSQGTQKPGTTSGAKLRHPATRPPRQPHPGRRSDRSRPVVPGSRKWVFGGRRLNRRGCLCVGLIPFGRQGK